MKDLLSSGANVDCQDLHDETPLYQACREGNYTAARVLLEHGASRSIVAGEMELTARDIADQRGHLDLVELLDQQRSIVSSSGTQVAGGGSIQQAALVQTPGFRGSLKKPRRRAGGTAKHLPQRTPHSRVAMATANRVQMVQLPDKPRPPVKSSQLQHTHAKSRYGTVNATNPGGIGLNAGEMPPSYDSLCASQLIAHQHHINQNLAATQNHPSHQTSLQQKPSNQHAYPHQMATQQRVSNHHNQYSSPLYNHEPYMVTPVHQSMPNVYSHNVNSVTNIPNSSQVDQQSVNVFARYPTPPNDYSPSNVNTLQHQPQTTPPSTACLQRLQGGQSSIPTLSRSDQMLLTPSPEATTDSPSPYNGQWSSDTGVNSPPLHYNTSQHPQTSQHHPNHQNHIGQSTVSGYCSSAVTGLGADLNSALPVMQIVNGHSLHESSYF